MNWGIPGVDICCPAIGHESDLMSQSLSRVLVHLVFSTSHREPFLNAPVRPKLFAYFAGVVRKVGGDCIRAGGVGDHVHLALNLGRMNSIAGTVEDLKTSSSKWLKTQPGMDATFAWQRGYGAFSVSSDDLDGLLNYIEGQEQHHQTRTFQEEYRDFLCRHKVAFDERYVWD